MPSRQGLFTGISDADHVASVFEQVETHRKNWISCYTGYVRLSDGMTAFVREREIHLVNLLDALWEMGSVHRTGVDELAWTFPDGSRIWAGITGWWVDSLQYAREKKFGRGVLPMLVDDGTVTICAMMAGGAREVKGMPADLTLGRMRPDGTEAWARYDFACIEEMPIDRGPKG